MKPRKGTAHGNDEYYTCQICGNSVYIVVPHECPPACHHERPGDMDMNCSTCDYWKKRNEGSEIGLCLYHSNSLFLDIFTRDCMCCPNWEKKVSAISKIGQEVWR
jgi:hypothetical protein